MTARYISELKLSWTTEQRIHVAAAGRKNHHVFSIALRRDLLFKYGVNVLESPLALVQAVLTQTSECNQLLILCLCACEGEWERVCRGEGGVCVRRVCKGGEGREGGEGVQG